jgi:transcriptional antiterminator RfaH
MPPTDDAHRWYVIHTKPQNERRVDMNLRTMGLETLCPMFVDDHAGRRPGAKARVAALFPGYIFGRFSVLQHWHNIRFTRGVKDVLNTEGRPLAVDDEVVRLVAERIGDDGHVHIGSPLKAGDRVVIRGGPFSSLIGVLESPANDQTRLSVLLTTINWSARLGVAREHVYPA